MHVFSYNKIVLKVALLLLTVLFFAIVILKAL